MTIALQMYAVVQCEWETDDKKWGCTVTDRICVFDTALVAAAIQQDELLAAAKSHFVDRGWQFGAPGSARCPGCVGRRTDTRERDADLEDVAGDDIYVVRFERFMSIKATPSELARRINKFTRSRSWTHSGKKSMADAYARQPNFNAPSSVPPSITDAMVDELIKEYGVKGKRKKNELVLSPVDVAPSATASNTDLQAHLCSGDA